MADRQALNELQTRLDSRLQAARSEGPSVAWLAAECGVARWLFPLAVAGEIFPWTPPQPVPYTARWLLGVANLRGSLHSVVDLAAFADPGATPAPASTDASLLTLNTALGVPCALRLDRLAGLRGGDAFTATEPSAGDAPSWYGSVYTDAKRQRWQEIDLQALAADPQFLNIAA